MRRVSILVWLMAVAVLPRSEAAYPVAHPVFSPTETLAAALERLAPVQGLSDAQLAAAVPETNGLPDVRCPVCNAGAQEDQLVWNGPSDPRGVHCRYCGTNFPNDSYPESHRITVTDATGTVRDFPYYLRGDGRRFFLSARANFLAKTKMAEFAQDFGEAYLLTGRQEYARKAAVILGRFAAVFPHYLPWHALGGTDYPITQRGPTDDWNESYWTSWSYEMIPTPLLYAYDAIYGSGELEKLSSGLKERIEHDIFGRAIDLQIAFRDHLTNAQPYTYRDYAVAGRILGRPDLIHRGLEGSRLLMRTQFFYDGFWKEGTPSYHRQTVNNLHGFFALLDGYQDPSGYIPPEGDLRIASGAFAPDLAEFARLQRAVDLAADPSGSEIRLADAWGQKLRPALLPEGGLLWGGLGLARLGYGSGPAMMQSYLNFTGKYGHEHADALSLNLFACGEELLPDIGYTHTRLRDYAAGTFSHNTVMVDGAPSNAVRGTPSGWLQRFSPFPDGPQLVEAADPAAYPRLLDYRRRLVQIPFSTPGRGYVLDVFWARGGTRYDYDLHGSADRPSRAGLSIPLGAPGSGEENFRDVRSGATDGTFAITWTGDDGRAGLRSTILGRPGTEVFLGRTPQVRPAEENDVKLDAFWRPSLRVRRLANHRAGVDFVAVHEPFLGHPAILSIAECQPAGGAFPPDAAALRIEHAEGVDYVITAKRPESLAFALADGRTISFRGVEAVIRFDPDGRLDWVYLYDVDRLQIGDLRLSLPPPVAGRLTGVVRHPETGEFAFQVEPLQFPGWPGLDPSVFAGAPILVVHGDSSTHGYVLKGAVAGNAGLELLLRGDPGFEIQKGETRFSSFPQNQIEGGNRVCIDSIAIVRFDGGSPKVVGDASLTWDRGGAVNVVRPEAPRSPEIEFQ